MFKIENTTIHCSRGDTGAFLLKLPITDTQENIKYEDEEGNTYWYNEKNNELYDSNYNISNMSIEELNSVFYKFQKGDKIRFNIYERNGYNKDVVMTKEVEVVKEAESVYIELLEEETTFGTPVNKPTTFWYDITLNENLTIICYDEDGAKEFIEYPAKGDDE